MAAVTPAVTPKPVQHCLPKPAAILLAPSPQFYKDTLPISATRYDSGGVPVSGPALAYSDYKLNMHRESHALGRTRMRPDPEFAFDDAKMRALLVTFWENKCGGSYALRKREGSERERLARAQAMLERQIPGLIERIDRLCAQYIQCNDAQQKQVISADIMHLDTQVQMIRRGPGYVLRLALAYWRRKLNATEIARELHCRPVYVRQTTHRLVMTWERMHRDSVQKVNEPRSVSQKTLEIITQLRHDGLSTYRIADACAAQGLRTLKGRPLTQTAISKICTAYGLEKKKAQAEAQATKEHCNCEGKTRES